jgi:hypothetical protein
MQLSDYAIAQLCNDYIPYWDYRLLDDAPHYRDTSAAAASPRRTVLLRIRAVMQPVPKQAAISC